MPSRRSLAFLGAYVAVWSASLVLLAIREHFLFFGVLWSRTRSLPLVIALHGLTDLVPDLLPFARHFHLA